MNESLETASALHRKPRRVSEPRDLVLVVLLAVFAVFLTDAFFFTGLNLGVSLGLIGVCACFVWYLWKARRAVTAYAVFCFLCLPALAVSLFCSDDSLLKFLACTAILILAAVGALELLNLRREQTGTCRSVLDVGWVRSLLRAAGVGLGRLPPERSGRRAEDPADRRGADRRWLRDPCPVCGHAPADLLGRGL